MHATTLPRWPLLAAASAIAVAIAIAAGLLFAQQAAADGDAVPRAPANPLAHLIVPQGEDPRVRVSWDAPDGTVSGYTVARADGRSFQAAGTATMYSDHSVEPGTSYTYAVTARNGQGSSASSASASVSVPDAPSQPGDLAAEVAEIQATDETASVTLTWTASTVPDAPQCETAYPLDGYTVLRSDGNGRKRRSPHPAVDAASFTDDSGRLRRHLHLPGVWPKTAIGDSPSAEDHGDGARPARPAGNRTHGLDRRPLRRPACPSRGTLQPKGRPSSATAVFRYLGADPYQGTERARHPGRRWPLRPPWWTATAQAGVTYSYLVLARSADNVSDPSNTAVIEAPAPPSGLTATAGDGAIDLSWQAPTAGTVAGYRVQRQDEQGDWTTLADTTEASHSDGAAQANVQYRYRVQHRNQYGGSAWTQSDPVTLVLVPGSPTGLTAAASGNDNLLTWTAPDSPFIDGYRVPAPLG